MANLNSILKGLFGLFFIEKIQFQRPVPPLRWKKWDHQIQCIKFGIIRFLSQNRAFEFWKKSISNKILANRVKYLILWESVTILFSFNQLILNFCVSKEKTSKSFKATEIFYSCLTEFFFRFYLIFRNRLLWDKILIYEIYKLG